MRTVEGVVEGDVGEYAGFVAFGCGGVDYLWVVVVIVGGGVKVDLAVIIVGVVTVSL